MQMADWVLLILRVATLVAEAGIFGTLAVQALSGPASAGRAAQDRLLAGLFGALLALLPGFMVAQAAVMVDAHGVAGIADAVWLVLLQTWVGHLVMLRAVAWVATWAAARRSVWLALAPASLALALHAAAGHAVAAGEPVLFASVLVHVWAGCGWIGGLPALVLALRGPDATRLVRRYAWYGGGCVGLVAVTAWLQADALAGGLPGLLGTSYGQALLVKLGLLAGLLGLAIRHRFVLAPALPARLDALRGSIWVELGLGVGVMAAASVLSSLPPGAHSQPDWPFSVRFSTQLMDDDELRREVLGAVQALGGALLLLVLAFLARRVRWPAIAAALVITWFAIPHLDLLLLPAVPTYYWQSETGESPASIAAGKAAYGPYCASCHGVGGEGDGPLAKSLPIPPADLTAAHLWDHTDGELYWWIAHGMPGPNGGLVMPASGLDDATIWSLIDYIHANNPNKPADGAPRGVHVH